MDQLKSKIRHVPDFPKPGILFYDITTLLGDPAGLRETIDALASPYAGAGIERVVGIESRGFILASAVADRLGAGFVPIRKPGQAAGGLRPRVVCARVRHRRGGDPQRRHQPRPARADRRRRAGHRRDGAAPRPTSSHGWAARFTPSRS